jgi:4-amino-4-deoxy-L-arabinose transferase-like glycosyltransferase
MTPASPRRWRPASIALILLAWAILQFGGLFTPGLLDDVDSVYIQIAREMLQRHDFVTPTIDGIRFFDKPPLMYWLAAGSMHLFGPHFGIQDWAARLPLALGVLALLFATYALANRLYSPTPNAGAPFTTHQSPGGPFMPTHLGHEWGTHTDRAGLYAALAMATALGPYLYTRFYIPDILIALWMTLSIHLFLIALDRLADHRSPLLPSLGFATVMALDVLTKGLIGIVFPLGFVLLYLAFTRNLRALLKLDIPAATALFLAIAAPWHILAALRNPPIAMPPGLGLPAHAGWAWFYLYNEHIARFLGKRIPHDYGQVPIPLFWLLLLLWLLPWVAWLPAALLNALRTLRTPANDAGRAFGTGGEIFGTNHKTDSENPFRLEDAVAKSQSPQIQQFQDLSATIDQELGIASQQYPVVGMYDGTYEPSVLTRIEGPVDFDLLQAAAALRGKLAHEDGIAQPQESVLLWVDNDEGHHIRLMVKLPNTSPAEALGRLKALGLSAATAELAGDATWLHILYLGMEQPREERLNELSSRLGGTTRIIGRGHGVFIEQGSYDHTLEDVCRRRNVTLRLGTASRGDGNASAQVRSAGRAQSQVTTPSVSPPGAPFMPSHLGHEWGATKPDRPREAALTLLLWPAIILGFFTLSSRQEYYHLPALPALAILAAGLLAAADSTEDTPAARAARRAGLRGALYFLVPLGTLLFALCGYLALTAPTPHPGVTLTELLNSNPENYNLSLGHLYDLTGQAMGFFRGPLWTVALGMLTLGPIAYLVRRRGHTYAANLLIAAAMTAVLLAAHEGLVRFYPTLGSKDLALQIEAVRRPTDLVLIDGELTAGSTLLFYTATPAPNTLLVNGRINGPWFGSFWPDAPRIFANDADLHRLWSGPRRLFLLTYHPTERSSDLAPFAPVHTFATAGGKTVLSNQ